MAVDYVELITGVWQNHLRDRIMIQWEGSGNTCYISHNAEYFAIGNFDFFGTKEVYYAGWGMSETNDDSWMIVTGLVITKDGWDDTILFDSDNIKINGRSLRGSYMKVS